MRVVLREAGREAALHARSPEEFVERVASVVVRVRVRVHRDDAGRIDGYALALVGDRDAAGHLVWFSSSRLARDLSMPRLVAVWASADAPPPPVPPQPGERFRPGRAEYFGALDQATRAVHDATDAVREDRRTAHPQDDERGGSVAADGIAHSLRDLLDLVGDGAQHTYPDLGDAARFFDRAARTPHTVLPNRWSDEARRLRTATWRLAAVGALPGRGAARVPLAALVAAIATLIAEIAAYQATKQRLAQAQAAHRCADALIVAGRRGHDRAQAAAARWRSPIPAAHARQPGPTPVPHPIPPLGPRPSSPPSQGPRRGR